MQYFDQNTGADRIPDDITPLVQGFLNNRQLFDDDDGPNVTSAVKYSRERQERRATSEYEGDDPFVKSIKSIFGFEPLNFQVESWQTIEELDRARTEQESSKGAILSAPTGFGKTEAFLGPLYQLQLEGRQDGAAIVYPSRALLQDQLGRVLEHIHHINATRDESLSVGLYMGGQPWNIDEVEGSDFFDWTRRGRPRFRLANCWCGDEGESHAFECHATSRGYTLQCEHDESHRFSDQELVLARSELVFNNTPDIILTTLESLESFTHKPNYDLVDHLDTVVMDEVHLYTQLRGAHAANIVNNVDEIAEESLLWVGSSATIDDPERFGRQVFQLPEESIETLSPPDSDYATDHNDYEHYYFMLSPEEGPGVSSMTIQQLMLLGHTMLEDTSGERGKLLSFIDSISQVNQKSIQFANADRQRRLWQYHLDGETEHWRNLSTAMDRQFINEPLETMSVFSDNGFDSDEAADSDILLSTSFLEVGIDVGDISIVTQYRTPYDLSSFLQRAGRAARKPGMDSHVAVFLSDLTNDANMFYRAGRFLGSSIRTPLKTDNPVVKWIHDKLRQYNIRAQTIIESRHEYLSDREQHEAFLEGYLRDDLGYPDLLKFITDPKEFLTEHFDSALAVPDQPLLSTEIIDEARQGIDGYLSDQGEQFADIEAQFQMEEGDVIRGTNAIDEYVLRVQDKVLDLINSFQGQVSGYEGKLQEYDSLEQEDLIADIRGSLASCKEAASTLPEGSASDKIVHFSQVMSQLFNLTGDLITLQTAASQVAEGQVPQVNTDRLSETHQTVNQLEALTSDDILEDYYRQKKEAYYLKESLDELEEYVDMPTDPYKSLYSVKHLLRTAYYMNRYLETAGKELANEVWFVPPDYYGSSGQFMTVFPEGHEVNGDQESIDQLIGTYTPYRSEYQSEAGTMQMFLPRTEVAGDTVQFDFSQHVTGREQDGILVPDEITLSEVEDLAGENAQNILQYCPVCFDILENGNCLRHDERETGKIHADSEVKTTVENRTVDSRTGDLALADVTATVTLEGVTLEISPAKYLGDDIGWVTTGEDRIEQRIESPETPLGFQLNTRGLVFDMYQFQDELDDAVRERVALYNDFGAVDYDYLTYHTAAHFFLQLVADVSSVNTTNLLYGFDQNEEEVYVFERTEGGQGVVDLMHKEIDTNPASVLESLNRIGYNPQVITERLWAQEEFVTALPMGEPSEFDVKSVVAEYLPIPFDSVQTQVTQEVLSTIDRCRQFTADTSGVDMDDVYRIKQTIAAEQVQGTEEYPQDVVAATAGVDLDHSRVETLFFSPDMDSCVENLQLAECIAGEDQGDSLSYVLVEALRDHLTKFVQSDEALDAMFDEYSHPPAAEYDDTSVFFNF